MNRSKNRCGDLPSTHNPCYVLNSGIVWQGAIETRLLGYFT